MARLGAEPRPLSAYPSIADNACRASTAAATTTSDPRPLTLSSSLTVGLYPQRVLAHAPRDEGDDGRRDEEQAAEDPAQLRVADPACDRQPVRRPGREHDEHPAHEGEEGGGPARVVARAVEQVVRAAVAEEAPVDPRPRVEHGEH